jgi:arylsulfatase A-like enzyme
MSRRPLLVVLLLLAGATGGFLYWRARRPPPRTVVLVSIDTLRPERLGLYGNAADVSPRIDALAAQSLVFERALANSPYTLPSHMTMLTGLDPVAHGIKRPGSVLSTRVTTLAELLRQAGFQCGAFTDGGFVSAGYGFSQGFHVYDDKRDDREEGAVNGFARSLPHALDWLDAHATEDVFLFVHTFDAHAPYQEGDPEVHEEFRRRPVPDGPRDHELYRLGFMHQQVQQRIPEYGRMSELLNDYDSGVHEADRGVGLLLDWLAEQGRLDDALFIVTSDHGESFADHGIHVGHGLALTDDEIHIPLVIKLPAAEAAGRRVATTVDLTDIAPTVLDVFGLPPAKEMQGESLLRLARGQPRRHEFIFGISPNTESCFLVHGNWKFISHPSIPPLEVAFRHLGPMTPPDGGMGETPGEEYQTGPEDARITLRYDTVGDPLGIHDALVTGARLYDLRADPQERVNLAVDDHERLAQLAEWAAQAYAASLALNAELSDGNQSKMGESHVETSLAQLGYLSAQKQEDIDKFLSEMPAETRQALQTHYEPPDVRALTEADKAMQYVRVALRDGHSPGENAPKMMQSLGDTLVEWAIANPLLSARVGWRLYELEELAQQAGVAVDRERWTRKWRDWAQKRMERRAQAAEEASPTPAPDGGSSQESDDPR